MHNITGKKKPIVLLAVVVAVLGILTWVFYHKVSLMLDAETQEHLLDLTEKQARTFEKSLQRELAFLTGVAKLAGYEKDGVNWQYIRESLSQNERKRFSSTGAVNLQGLGIIGPDLPIGQYQGLQQAFRGYDTISAIPPEDGGDEARFLLATPVMHGNNVRYALYALIAQDRLHGMIDEAMGDSQGVAMIMDADGRVVLPIADPDERADIERWQAEPEKYGIAQDIQSLTNKVKRYKKGVERFLTNDGGDFYVEVVPMRINEWRFFGLVPGKVTRSRVESVARLFLLVFGALLLLFIAVLAYLQVVDSGYRAQLFSLAYIDRLTGLPNWEKMRQDLTNLAKAEKLPKDRMLVSFDIKGFKIFNEMFGYQRGDHLLNHIAQRLKSSTDDKNALICRYENDCFAYIAPNREEEDARQDIQQRLDEISGHKELEKLRLRFACGVCTIPGDGGRDWNVYMNASRIAREQAKKSPDTSIAFYNDNLRNQIIQAERLRSDLEDAIANAEFLMYLQPKFVIAYKGHEKIAGAEALVRWHHRERGLLAPNVFIPIFEEDGSIEKIDRYMFEQACRCLSLWIRQRRPAFPISVNLSRVQLSNPNLVRELTDIADAYQTPRQLIDIELTESASFGDMKRLLRLMHEIKSCGFKLSLDDFGTGYSSLSLLRDMPMDVLKLDKSFIDPLRHSSGDSKNLQFIRDIIRMAENLGIQTLAEGVETERQLDILRDVNCDIVQGYYFSRPVPVQEYEQLINTTGTDTFVVQK